MAEHEIYDYDSMKEAVNEYGEVHAPLKDEDEYEAELRRGQVVWHDDEEAVSIRQYGYVVDTFKYEDMLNPYCPQEYKHRE